MNSFDATLMVKGHESLVSNGRSLGKKGGSITKRMGKRLSAPLSRFSAAGIARYIICASSRARHPLIEALPLNFVPGLGTALFLVRRPHAATSLTRPALQRQPRRTDLSRPILPAQEALAAAA